MYPDDQGLTSLTGGEITAGVTSGRFTAEDVVRAFLARTTRLEPEIGTYVTLDAEGALAAARAIPARLAAGEHLPLAGLPLTLKDQIWTAGLRTTGGSRVFAEFIPETDAPVVARLRAAGAIVLGKTVTPEFGLFWRAGAQIGPETRNPWDITRTSGGSSAGAAAGVAGGLTPVAIGSDGAGSIRLPAAFCGVAGLAPTLGRIPRSGNFDGARLFTQIGPLAHSVRDLARLLDILAGPDSGDPLSLTCPPLRPAPPPGSRLRLAFWDDPGVMAPDHDPRVLACVRAAAERLVNAGHRLIRLDDPPDTDAILPHFRTISGSDRLAFLGEGILADPERASRLGPYVRQAWATAATVPATDYARAMAHREAAIADLRARFDTVDVILSPTAGTVANHLPGVTEDPLWRPPGYFAYTFVANYTGFPALTLPCALVDGLPVGLHLMGPPGSEPLLLQLGRQAEALFGPFRPPLR